MREPSLGNRNRIIVANTVPARHNRVGESGENTVRFAPTAMCRRTLTNGPQQVWQSIENSDYPNFP